MVGLTTSFLESSSRNTTTSTHNHEKSNKQTVSTVFTIGVFAIVFIAIILVSYRLFYKYYMKRKQTDIRPRTRPRTVTSIFATPVHNNIILDVIEVPPPCYCSTVHLQERQSDPIARI